MKRTITIYLVDGRNLSRDYYEFAQALQIPIGAPISHPAIANIARMICTNGTIDDANCDEHNMQWIGPAQIKKVSITETITLVKS